MKKSFCRHTIPFILLAFHSGLVSAELHECNGVWVNHPCPHGATRSLNEVKHVPKRGLSPVSAINPDEQARSEETSQKLAVGQKPNLVGESHLKQAELKKIDQLYKLSRACNIPSRQSLDELKRFCRLRSTSAAECATRNNALYQELGSGDKGLLSKQIANPLKCLEYAQKIIGESGLSVR